MKICPTCRRTYEDDGLNFCLEDGSVLTFTSPEPAPTIVMEQPRRTDPTPGGAPQWGTLNATANSVQPPKKSLKAWVWVLGIFAILILVCGGGFVGFFVYVASIANTNATANKGVVNAATTKANTTTRSSPGPSQSPAVATSDAKAIDLSGWVEEPTVWLASEFADGEFFMTSKQKGYYYVLVAKDEEFANAGTSRVTVRNVDDKEASMGYGLVFHSDTTPLKNSYALLIDTKRKKFRVVRHEGEQEKTVTAWTNSNLIKPGSEPNVLEARDRSDKIDLYINGQLATAITIGTGPKRGVPGLYVGDGAKIGFSKLEIVK